jgi:hypothetical protein
MGQRFGGVWGPNYSLRTSVQSGLGPKTLPSAMQYGGPNFNEGKSWSEMDLVDLRNSLAHGRTVAEIAEFLCRSEREVQEKVAELKRLI